MSANLFPENTQMCGLLIISQQKCIEKRANMFVL